MKKFAATHEWIEIQDGIATIGISNFASEEMGELVYIELPEVGRTYRAGEEFGSVESRKAVEMIHAPISGKICAVNAPLADDPTAVNEAPEGNGWICKMDSFDEAELANLMTLEEYTEKNK